MNFTKPQMLPPTKQTGVLLNSKAVGPQQQQYYTGHLQSLPATKTPDFCFTSIHNFAGAANTDYLQCTYESSCGNTYSPQTNAAQDPQVLMDPPLMQEQEEDIEVAKTFASKLSQFQGDKFQGPSLQFLLSGANGINSMRIEASSHKDSLEKDRAISNDTVGLSTTELTPQGGFANHFNFEEANPAQTYKVGVSQLIKYQSQPAVLDNQQLLMLTAQIPISLGPNQSAQQLSNQKPTLELKEQSDTIDLLEDPLQKKSKPAALNLNIDTKEAQNNGIINNQSKTPRNGTDKSLKDIKNFQLLAKVGEGAYGTVWKALHISSQKVYAIKVISKSLVEKLDKMQEVFNERNILMKVTHPSVVKLHSSFLDKKNVYMVLDYAPNGDFSKYLKLNNSLKYEEARFYLAQIVSILGCLNAKNIIHRDLKPANFLFSESWHLLLTDFGTAKELKNSKSSSISNGSSSPMNISPHKNAGGAFSSFSSVITRQSSANNLLNSADANLNIKEENQAELFTNKPEFNMENLEPEARGSFVGTEDYIAPEIINSEPSTFASDLWSLGVIAFQLLTGKSPFKTDNQNTTFDRILACDYQMPDESKVPLIAQDLIKKLLVLNPNERLGNGSEDNSLESLKQHKFFEGINFSSLHLQKAPIAPKTIKCTSMNSLSQQQSAPQQQNDQIMACSGLQKSKSANEALGTDHNDKTSSKDFSDLVRVQGKEIPKEETKGKNQFYLQPVINEDHFRRNSSRNRQKAQAKNVSSFILPLCDSPNVQQQPGLYHYQTIKKNASSFSLAQNSLDSSNQNNCMMNTSQDSVSLQHPYVNWKELRSENVKKRSKVFFFADRSLKIYETGYFAYFKIKKDKEVLKALIQPQDFKQLILETGSNKDRLKIVSKEKSYLFRFNSADIAKDWFDILSQMRREPAKNIDGPIMKSPSKQQ